MLGDYNPTKYRYNRKYDQQTSRGEPLVDVFIPFVTDKFSNKYYKIIIIQKIIMCIIKCPKSEIHIFLNWEYYHNAPH